MVWGPVLMLSSAHAQMRPVRRTSHQMRSSVETVDWSKQLLTWNSGQLVPGSHATNTHHLITQCSSATSESTKTLWVTLYLINIKIYLLTLNFQAVIIFLCWQNMVFIIIEAFENINSFFKSCQTWRWMSDIKQNLVKCEKVMEMTVSNFLN